MFKTILNLITDVETMNKLGISLATYTTAKTVVDIQHILVTKK